MPDSSDTALPPVAIDRRSPIPFYFQLTKLLTREIETGRAPHGLHVDED